MKCLMLILTLLISFQWVNVSVWSEKSTAVSSGAVIYQVQTGGAAATQEFILLYNQSLVDLNISKWCLRYSSASDNTGFQTCINTPDTTTELWVESGGFVSFATADFVLANPTFTPDIIFTGGMAAASGHLRLFDGANVEIDKVGWGAAISPETTSATAHPTGKVLSRNIDALSIDTDNNATDFSSQPIKSSVTSGLYEVYVPVDICLNIDELQITVPLGYMQDEDGECYLDVCPNLDELQKTIPSGYELHNANECALIPLEDRTIFITELYPDAPSYDTGQEFIELYNPHNATVNLKGYRLQVGPSFTIKQYIFSDIEIGPFGYITLNDLETGIVLPNSSGVALRLIAPAGNTVATTAVYENADDGTSWALVEDEWIYTNQITRGSTNKPYIEQAVDEVVGVTSVQAPCPIGKYRNSETNRCRAIEIAVSQLKPCDEDQSRNPETNRCRNIATASSTLKPCEEGQERNKDTNRCRKVSVLGATSESDIAKIEDATVQKSEGQLNWPIMASAVGLTGSYMLYEWRNELRMKLRLRRATSN